MKDKASQKRANELRMNDAASVLVILAGVLLPVVTLGVELATGMCAESLFDPLPTVWHGLIIAFVPLANWQVWREVRRGGEVKREALTAWANALAIGVALFYTIVFLPLTPIALVAALGGVGLLPLAPLVSFCVALYLRTRLVKTSNHFAVRGWRGFAVGVCAAWTMLLVIEMPATITRVGMKWAKSMDVAERERGMSLLRAAGSEEMVLRACFERTGWATDPIGFLMVMDDAVTTDEARGIYYRLTGNAFDAVVPPRLAGRFEPLREVEFDFAQGGEAIGGRLRGLSLNESRMDGSVDADAALGYLEWTLVFKNETDVQREARATVQLPAGAVVSRLTLWINGEEREAAYAARSRVRAAYRSVVREQRDPVLVTTAGVDRVLVQCFPVPPKGEMKVKLGISAPMKLKSGERATLRLPYFAERNFRVDDAFKHQVWFEGKTELQSAIRLLKENPHANLYAVRGAVSDKDLSEPHAAIGARRDANVKESRVKLPDSDTVIREIFVEQSASSFKHLVLVIDASRQMKSYANDVAEAIENMPREMDVSLIVAGDNQREMLSDVKRDAPAQKRLMANAVRSASYEGGADNVPALERAWDVAMEKPHSAVVWLHAPQPVLLSSVEGLRQRIERRPRVAPIILFAVKDRANRVLEKLDGLQEIKTHARTGKVQDDLREMFAQLSGNVRLMSAVREELKAGEVKAGEVKAGDVTDTVRVKETSLHLARLWAKDEVERLMAAGDEAGAVTLAVKHRIVTPVSGAVVLETQEQYERAGLKAVEAGTVPSVPEPETVLLIAVVATLLMWSARERIKLMWRRRAC